MFVSMVLDTILVSRSFMDSTFEIPTSTSSRILSTGENLKKQKLLSSFFVCKYVVVNTSNNGVLTVPKDLVDTQSKLHASWATVIWPNFCRFGVKHYMVNQSITLHGTSHCVGHY